MITGLGIDIIEVARVAEKIQKDQGFKELVFSEEEITYCEPKPHRFQHYAARFAAKEAFFKALGTGWANETAFNEIVITQDEAGKPEITLKGVTAKTLQQLYAARIHVSLSHLKDMAAAVVVIEQ